MELEIRRLEGRTDEAVALHLEMSEEMAVRYDHMDDGTGGYVFPDVYKPGHAFLVGYVGDTAVACGAYRPYSPGVAEVKRMFVRKAHRGQGHSKAILKALEEFALADGYSKTILETADRQPDAISLYKKAGYIQIPNYPPYVNSVRSLCFEKELWNEGLG